MILHLSKVHIKNLMSLNLSSPHQVEDRLRENKNMDKDNFEIAITDDYKHSIIDRVRDELEKRLPDYIRSKIVIIKVIDSQ